MAEPNEPVGPGPGPDAEPKPSEETEGSAQFTVVDRRFWAARAKEGNGEPSGVGPSMSRVPTFVARLQEQLEEKERVLRTHVAELRTQHEDLRRRLTRELEQRVELATGNLLTDFLPVLDNLERALSAAEQRPQLDTLLEGIRLVQGQFVSLLGRYGLTPLARQGQPFDPSLDEAVTTLEVEDPGQNNLVLQEWEKGYTLHDKILRAAKVVVGKLGAEDR